MVGGCWVQVGASFRTTLSALHLQGSPVTLSLAESFPIAALLGPR